MTIHKNQEETKLTLTLTGRLDTTTAPQLETEVNAITADINHLIMNFADLEYLSSAGLRVILAAQKKMAAPRSMTIQNVNETILEVFEITGFIDILTIE